MHHHANLPPSFPHAVSFLFVPCNSPRYGSVVTTQDDEVTVSASLDTATSIPYTLWKVAGGCMAFGAFLLFLCFFYSLFACFGFFHHKIQKWSIALSSAAGVFILIGLLVWGASFKDMAVTHCDSQTDGAYDAASDECASFKGLLPSRAMQQPYPGTHQCLCLARSLSLALFISFYQVRHVHSLHALSLSLSLCVCVCV